MNQQANSQCRFRADPEELGPVLSRFLAKSGLTQVLAQQRLREDWMQAVGPLLAPHTRLAGYKQNVLRVEVDSAVYLHELAAFHKDTILQRLRAGTGSPVQEIVFRVASF